MAFIYCYCDDEDADDNVRDGNHYAMSMKQCKETMTTTATQSCSTSFQPPDLSELLAKTKLQVLLETRELLLRFRDELGSCAPIGTSGFPEWEGISIHKNERTIALETRMFAGN